MLLILRILVFCSGLILVAGTLLSAIRTFVLPRGAQDFLTAVVFRGNRKLLALLLKSVSTYAGKDRIMALYAPISLLALLPTWLVLVAIGYTGMYWATGIDDVSTDFAISGSSLLTLGFAQGTSFIHTLLAFTEATIGLILVALLIAYLPTIYNAFARRELAVTLLEARAGSPPSAVEMLKRYQRIGGLDRLADTWQEWERWFADVAESHTSLAAVVFLRSPQPEHSWITTSGAVLDAAALTMSVLDRPRDPEAALCIRSGYLTLRSIAKFFGYSFTQDPHFPQDPISISRSEFDQAYEELKEAGLPLRLDRDQAWQDFGGWRVNYDSVLVALCHLTMAPYAPWSSDRRLDQKQFTT